MKATGKPGDAPTPESEDIAKLLRALNEDLKADPIDDVADIDEDEEELAPPRGLPLGKIAAALLTAAGIGFAVVMLDPTGSVPTEPATGTAALVPPPPAITRAPTPAATPAPPPAAPESMIARAPAPSAAPAAAPASAAPAPPPPVAAPAAPPPVLKVPEPPALPPVASATPAPRAPTAKPAEAPPPAPAPRAEAPRAEPAAPPPAPAPKVTDGGELQAMLAPPKEPREVKRAPAKPAEAKAVESKPATSKPILAKPAESPAGAPSVGGRYAIQIGTFKVAENADSMTRRLQGGGFPAYTLGWTDASNQSWRAVRVGGYADAAAAKRAAGELKTKMGVDSVVVTTR